MEGVVEYMTIPSGTPASAMGAAAEHQVLNIAMQW
jgi:hypothetical protein